jgi:ABC-type nickel/cobalt efflux system permease component RcnA
VTPLLPFATALLLGSVHALEPDHIAAVTSFAVRRPEPRAAVGFGIRWAAGHGAVLVLVGGALFLLGIHFPGTLGAWLERLVGLLLVGLGLWTVRGAFALHAHVHRHADGVRHLHVHSHLLREGHDHRHAATAMGIVHGLAGTAPALALLPLTRLETAASALGYLVAFSLGTALGMGLYALCAGFVAGRAATRSVRFARLLAATTGAATAAVGVVWMLR